VRVHCFVCSHCTRCLCIHEPAAVLTHTMRAIAFVFP
jgi:hypothetical protein